MYSRFLFSIAALLLLACTACDKESITQSRCERQTNRADCEAAGCTFACGVSLLKESGYGVPFTCLARRRVGTCLAMVPYFFDNPNVSPPIEPGQTRWVRSFVRNGEEPYTYIAEYIRVINTTDEAMEVIGHPSNKPQDPCLEGDPDESLFPWEGACETDWRNEDLWDDVLSE